MTDSGEIILVGLIGMIHTRATRWYTLGTHHEIALPTKALRG